MERPGLTYITLLFMATFWSGVFIVGRLTTGRVHPIHVSTIRFVVAAVVLLIYSKLHSGHLELPSRQQLPGLLFLSVSGVVFYNVLIFYGIRDVEASRASLIIASNPVLITLFSVLVLRERLTLLRGAGVLLAFSGAVIVITHGGALSGSTVGRGELLLMGAAVCWAAYSLAGQHVMRSMSPLFAVTWNVTIGAIIFLVAGFFTAIVPAMATWQRGDWIGLVFLGVCSTALAFLFYYAGIRQIGAVRAGLFINFVPLNAVLLAWLLLGETVTPSLVIGAVTIVSGAYLANRRPVPRRTV